MKNDSKTKKQLIDELAELRSQNAALNQSITGSTSAELAVEEAHCYAESIVATIREPLLVLDADLKIISANRNFYKTFKVTPDETIGSFIYDLGNKQWDIPKLRELLEEVLPEKEAFDDFEVAHNFQDIGQKDMLLNARQIYRKNIGTKMILLAIEDITERRKLEEAHNNLAAIVESADDAIIGKDLAGIIVSWNRGAEIAYGYNAKDVIGKSISLLMPPGHPEEYKELLTKRSSGKLIKNYETQRMRKDGKIVDVSLTISPVKDTSGEITGDSIIVRDITDRKRAEEALRESEKRYRELSIVDGLTQLYNSRHFYFKLKIELDRSNRYEQPLTLLLLDLDNFKAFNDAYGHVEGDQVLLRLGQVVKRCLRQTDSAYRYGGEEFTFLLPMTKSADGTITAERIRTEFKKEAFSPETGQDVHMTVSIGLAQYKPKEEMKAFVHRVDQLMYQGKKSGKDMVCSDP
jgi:diguanylate cyclase (GGDEF)-like protein/PAS domain S-box-containing protein